MAIDKRFEKSLRQRVEATPYYSHLHIRLDKIDTGFARFRLPFRRELLQINQIVHGGAIVSLADTAVAFALLTVIQPGERVTTVELKMNFLAPVVGEEIFGEGRVIQRGKRLALTDMEVKNEKGKLIAKGLATYMILSPEKSERGRRRKAQPSI